MNIPTIPEDQIEFDKVIVFNTAHITENDDKLLTANASQELCIDQFDYGYRIFVPVDYTAEDFIAVVNVARAEGFSEHLCTLLQLAQKHKANWVKLDCDGAIYEQLTTFEW